MAKLPSAGELEHLYHKKGKDALAWCVWRNALRILPLLGRRPLHKVWYKNTVHNIYALCRINVLCVKGSGLKAEFIKAAMSTATPEALRSAYNDIKSAEEDIARITNTNRAIKSAARTWAEINAAEYYRFNAFQNNWRTNSTAWYAEDAVEAIRSTVDVAIIIGNSSETSSITAAVNSTTRNSDLDLAVAASRADFKKSLSKKSILKQNWLVSPLWPKNKFLPGTGKSKYIIKCEQLLLEQLRQLGLDFLAEDIEAIWKGQGIPLARLKNYEKNLSLEITNDPEALRKAIVGEIDLRKIQAVRCLLLGPGGAGKSSLADRLRNERIQLVKDLTIGVDYLEHQPLNLKDAFPKLRLDYENLNLYLWDFGGQTIFHGLHSAFLHENCVYVLVVDSRHEQAPDEWLHQIRHLAGLQAKVLLVTNWYEQCETRQNEARLLREFSDLLLPESFFYFSCLDKEAKQLYEFVEALVQDSLDSQKMVFKETLDVQEILQNQYQDDVFLSEDSLDKLIEKITGKINITASMTKSLQQLGFLVRVDSDGQHFCLKPEWAIDHAYQLLYSPRLRKANGVLTLAELQQEFQDQAQVSKKYTGHLVSFLRERSLCQRLKNDAYFFPDAAPANEPETATKILQNQQGLIIRFDLPYLPLGFHARLVNHLFVPGNDVSIIGPEDIWRQGFILRKGETKAVVHYLLRKNVIEMVLVGDLTDFSALLNTLYVNLKAVMTAGEGMHANQIHPSVKMHDEIFSVHSAEGLVRVLEGINDYGQLFDKVRAMAAKYNITATDSTVVVDAKTRDSQIGNNNQQNPNNITVTSDQREQIAVLADALLGNAQNLQPKELAAVAEVKQALAEPEQEVSKGLLGNIWQATTDIVGFGSNLAQLHQWGTQNAGLIAAAWAAGATLLP